MSYYTLPKFNFNNKNINPIINTSIIEPYISSSFIIYYNNLYSQQNQQNINLFLNSYEYNYSKVLSVSKLKISNNLFYELVEIFNILHFFNNTNNIKTLFITTFINDVECIKMLRNNNINNDSHFILNKIDEISTTKIEENDKNNNKFDFIFYEIENNQNINLYIIDFIKIFMVILKNQSNNGNCLIKINHIFYKPIIDLLYILNSNYKKMYIIKPEISNIITHEKYILCTQFINNNNTNELYNIFQDFLKKYTENTNTNANVNIISIIDFNIPLHFINKINDINILFGQQQLESLNQIISFKNKEKIKIIKNLNIQKSIDWCKKNKIPHNTFTEKVNIFLPLLKEI